MLHPSTQSCRINYTKNESEFHSRKWPNVHSPQKLVVSVLLVQPYRHSGAANAFTRTPSLSITANIRKHHYPLAVPTHETIPRTRCQPSDLRVVDKRTRSTSKRSNWSDFVLFHPARAKLKMREHLSRTGSVPVVKSSLAPIAPSVVRAVHQDESPGRRLFYYANTRRFHASHAKRGRSAPSPSFATHRRSDSSKKRSNIAVSHVLRALSPKCGFRGSRPAIWTS